MSGFVYLWFDRKRRRFYVGSHWGSQRDRYICSSLWMKRAYKRRPGDFKRRIIAIVTTSRRDLLIEEARWLAMIKPSELKVRYYNLKNRLDNFWHTDPDDLLSVGAKISKALKGRPLAHGFTQAVRAAISKGKRAHYDELRAAGLPLMNERTRKAFDRTGIPQTDVTKKKRGRKLAQVRAANPDWDKIHDRTCAHCGAAFRGRESQVHCSVKCRRNHSNHALKAAADPNWRTSYEKECQQCGAQFTTQRRPQKFCCANCTSLHGYYARGGHQGTWRQGWEAKRRAART